MKTLIRALFVGAIFFSARAFAQVPADPVVSVTGQATAQQTVTVTVTESTSGATLVYTTNGSIPTTSSPAITSGSTILIPQNAILQVQAFNGPTNASSIITEKFTLAGMVAAGTIHTLILKNDGTVWASGDNSAGELGDGLTTPSSTPVQVKTGSSTNLTGVVSIAAGNDESFAVDASGHVWAWGLNTNSQLGIGTSVNAVYATQISPTTLSNMIGIAASGNHALGLRADGTVFGWGSNGSGQVGNGTTSTWVTIPTQVLAPSGQSGALSGIVAVSAGTNHSLALTSAGNVYAWGSDSAGQLGDNDSSLTSHSLPVVVQKSGSALSNVVALAGGALNSFVLTGSGSVLSWGDNTVGELGNGTTSPATPVNPTNLSAAPLSGLSVAVAAVSSESAYGNGNAYTWGDNTYGETGAGVTGGYADLPLAVNVYTGTASSVADSSGNNQTVNSGAFSNPLTITVTNGGSPVQNATVYFTVNEGGGLLADSNTSTQFSDILEVQTNAAGQASIYFEEPSGSSGSSQVTATSDDGTSVFSLLSGGTGVPTVGPWIHGQTSWRRGNTPGT